MFSARSLIILGLRGQESPPRVGAWIETEEVQILKLQVNVTKNTYKGSNSQSLFVIKTTATRTP